MLEAQRSISLPLHSNTGGTIAGSGFTPSPHAGGRPVSRAKPALSRSRERGLGRGRAHRMREKFVLQNHPPAACLCLLTSLEPGDWLSITLTLAGHSPIATMPWEALAASPAPSAMARPILPPARQPGEQRWHSALTPAACGARKDGAEWHVAGPRTVHVYSRHWWPSDCKEAAPGQKLVWPLAEHGRM